MRMHELISVVVLLLAGTTQAVNTVSPLTNKGSDQVQQDLVGGVGPSMEGAVTAQGQPLDISNLPEDMFGPTLDIRPDVSILRPEDAALPLVQAVRSDEEQSPRGLIERVNGAVGWGSGHHWSSDPKKYSDAGFVDASSQAGLPEFDETDWAATALPAVRKMSIMEIVVFPALAAMALVLVVVMPVLRLCRRRPEEDVPPLMQV